MPSKKRGKKRAARPVEPSALEEALSTAEDPTGQPITIKVCAQNGKEISFGIKTTTKLGKVMQAFAVRMGMPIESLRFVVDGGRVNEGSTPQTLEMEDGDVIDCMLTFDGGGGGDSSKKRAREDALEDLDTLETDKEKELGWPNLKRAFGKEISDATARANLRSVALAVEHSLLVAQSILTRTEMDLSCSVEHNNRCALEIAKMIRHELQHNEKNWSQERAATAFEVIGSTVEDMGKAALFAE